MYTRLWMPESARQLIFKCELCGTRFPENQKRAWRRHVSDCAKQHEGEIQQWDSQRRGNALLTTQDTERKAYLKKNPRNRGLRSLAGRKQ